MIKTLYHGSEFVIKSPQFGVGRMDNDYGRGFYCTERLELALRTEWLSRKQERDQAARSAYFDSRRNPVGRGELMAFQIWQEEVKPNDPRLFR